MPVPEPPNVLYVHSHDTGRYVQPYGHAIPTPNLQRLAEQGVLFRQCFAVGPTCTPSGTSPGRSARPATQPPCSAFSTSSATRRAPATSTSRPADPAAAAPST